MESVIGSAMTIEVARQFRFWTDSSINACAVGIRELICMDTRLFSPTSWVRSLSLNEGICEGEVGELMFGVLEGFD